MTPRYPLPHKYDQLRAAGKRLARVPRYGRLIALLPPGRFNLLVTEAATFWEVYTYIAAEPLDDTGVLDGGLRAHRTRTFGTSQSRIAPLSPDFREFQVRHACDILGAVAYEMFVHEAAPRHAARDTEALHKAVVNRLHGAKVVDFFGDALSKQDLLEHLNAVFDMDAAALKYFIFSAFEREVRWTDITTQAFFAAYWACRWADDEDRHQMWKWLPDPLSKSKGVYAEFWRFVAEMPVAAYNPARFELLLAPLYDGTWRDGNDLPIRSTELIYRSWDGMKDTPAGQVFRGEFRNILAGSCENSLTARRLLEVEGENERRESQFVSLCRGERGKKDTGRFEMGAPDGEEPDWDGRGERQNNPLHPVRLTHYRLHRNCVTNLEYELFDRRHFARRAFSEEVKDVGAHPVVNVTWYDAWCFAAWIGVIEVGGEHFRVVLPSEAQWEYACRAGETTPFTWDAGRDGSRIESGYCNFAGLFPWELSGTPAAKKGDYRGRTVRVDGMEEDGTRIPANIWGFSQMHGNVWEWCGSWYDESEIRRVVRGGSFNDAGEGCRSDARNSGKPGGRDWRAGFRLAAVPVAAGGEEAFKNRTRAVQSQPTRMVDHAEVPECRMQNDECRMSIAGTATEA